MTTYNFTIFDTTITTLVSTSQDSIDDWIDTVYYEIDNSIHPRILGLGVELVAAVDADGPIATIHLSFGSYCLIYHVYLTVSLPPILEQFLFDMDITFVGVGLQSKIKLLEATFGCDVAYVDLGLFAADVYSRQELRGSDMSELAMHVLEKDTAVVGGRGDVTMQLSDEQVEYATIGAYVSLQMGLVLLNAAKPERVSLLKAQQEKGAIERVCYVEVLDRYLLTTVTMQAVTVENWLDDVMHDGSVHRYVGFDVRQILVDNQPHFGTIQFCTGFRCLIIQLYQMNRQFLPNLERFLIHDNNTFVGIDIERKMRLLVTMMLYIEVRGDLRGIDLGRFVATIHRNPELNNAGHERLAELLLDTRLEKPDAETDWGRGSRLSNAQVKCACIDAAASLEIANQLLSGT